MKVPLQWLREYVDLDLPVATLAELDSAMGLNTNTLMSNAGGTATADYVQGLNESSVRGTTARLEKSANCVAV